MTKRGVGGVREQFREPGLRCEALHRLRHRKPVAHLEIAGIALTQQPGIPADALVLSGPDPTALKRTALSALNDFERNRTLDSSAALIGPI